MLFYITLGALHAVVDFSMRD